MGYKRIYSRSYNLKLLFVGRRFLLVQCVTWIILFFIIVVISDKMSDSENSNEGPSFKWPKKKSYKHTFRQSWLKSTEFKAWLKIL